MSSQCKLQEMGEKLDKINDNMNNNNVDNYRHNIVDGSINGRISGGSQESAFSLSSSIDGDEDCSQSSSDQHSTNGHDNQSTSGRSSSANEDTQSLDNDKLLVVDQSNLVPETSKAMQAINAVRMRFLETLKEEDNADLFDSSDIEELRKPLPDASQKERSMAVRLISRYLDFTTQEKDVKNAVDSLRELLKFRHKYQLPKTIPDHFCQEYFLLNGIFIHGHDKKNLPVLYIRARVHRKWSAAFDESFRRYVAWQVDRLTKSNFDAEVAKTIGCNGLEKDGSFGMVFDCLNVSYSCLDMDFLKFLVHLFVNYYPSYCRYVWLVDLPWIFRSVWKLVRTWLPEDSKVQLITAKQLTDYIDENQIPNSMKINDLKASEKPKSSKHQLPKNFDSIRTIDGLGPELELSSSEIKQFKAHVEKVRKEYEQMGAL